MTPRSIGTRDSRSLEAKGSHLSFISGLYEVQGHVLFSLHPASALRQGQYMAGVGAGRGLEDIASRLQLVLTDRVTIVNAMVLCNQ